MASVERGRRSISIGALNELITNSALCRSLGIKLCSIASSADNIEDVGVSTVFVDFSFLIIFPFTMRYFAINALPPRIAYPIGVFLSLNLLPHSPD